MSQDQDVFYILELSSNGKFSVKNLYDALMITNLPNINQRMWKLKIPLIFLKKYRTYKVVWYSRRIIWTNPITVQESASTSFQLRLSLSSRAPANHVLPNPSAQEAPVALHPQSFDATVQVREAPQYGHTRKCCCFLILSFLLLLINFFGMERAVESLRS